MCCAFKETNKQTGKNNKKGRTFGGGGGGGRGDERQTKEREEVMICCVKPSHWAAYSHLHSHTTARVVCHLLPHILLQLLFIYWKGEEKQKKGKEERKTKRGKEKEDQDG
ncbi:hypothetical protein TCDM_02224 [Trypanosoma cruzi Dm28c]|uniref:Uncharacterized protein n=1 Tax=Trypanosoma cruzi Dm28c TaxID=1416333 RepID=V5BMC9_TRYCR|nr:hypothetical protein TCDM_02224 [Trypanosoma cruzi Dm28c]